MDVTIIIFNKKQAYHCMQMKWFTAILDREGKKNTL